MLLECLCTWPQDICQSACIPRWVSVSLRSQRLCVIFSVFPFLSFHLISLSLSPHHRQLFPPTFLSLSLSFDMSASIPPLAPHPSCSPSLLNPPRSAAAERGPIFPAMAASTIWRQRRYCVHLKAPTGQKKPVQCGLDGFLPSPPTWISTKWFHFVLLSWCSNDLSLRGPRRRRFFFVHRRRAWLIWFGVQICSLMVSNGLPEEAFPICKRKEGKKKKTICCLWAWKISQSNCRLLLTGSRRY